MKLQKWISQSGRLSRRAAEQAISDGRVRVNGQIHTEMGLRVDPAKDLVELDGQKIESQSDLSTFIFYKPRGVMTTKFDDRGRRTVMDFFKDHPDLDPVGRLDFESEGLLLLTNDGDFLLKMTHPRYQVPKTYEVDLDRALSEEEMLKLKTGVQLEDGEGKFQKIEWDDAQTYLIRVTEGRNRFIRRMIGSLDVQVLRLKRIQMGPFTLEGTSDEMKPGMRAKVDREKIEAFKARFS